MELNFSAVNAVFKHATLFQSFFFFLEGGGMVLRWKGGRGGSVAFNSMENRVFLLSHSSPAPSFLPFFGYFGFLIGSVIHIASVECRKHVCCVIRAWVSGELREVSHLFMRLNLPRISYRSVVERPLIHIGRSFFRFFSRVCPCHSLNNILLR